MSRWGLLFAAYALLASPAEAACRHDQKVTAKLNDGVTYTLRAQSTGGNCAKAEVKLTLLGPSGSEVFSLERLTSDLPSVFPAKPASSQMREALRDWIGQAVTRKRTGQLPSWAPGGWMRVAGEPFVLDPIGLTRASYAALRKANRPMLCFWQGEESKICVTPDGDRPARGVGLYIFQP